MKNFILKTVFLLILTISSNKIYSQNFFHLIVNNSTNCDVTVEVYGGSPSTLLATFNVNANTNDTLLCSNGNPLNVIVYDGLNSTGCSYSVPAIQPNAIQCPACASTCCFAINNVFITTSKTGPVGPPPGSCNILGFLYTQTVNIF